MWKKAMGMLCVVVVTHSNELAQKADVILTLKKGAIVGTEDVLSDWD